MQHDARLGEAGDLHERVIAWYDQHARDLPWRRPGTTPWAVLVSEIMLQQTQVDRVRPAYEAWLERWPTPAALAAEPAGEAVRQWGRLGYPRRALRLHAAAQRIVTEHGGAVPRTYQELRALPGIGDYTAAAVASFAYGGRAVVLDTNVRRVLSRLLAGQGAPAPSITAVERRLAEQVLPAAALAPRWAVATMELGALVCTSRAPACPQCPVLDRCAWQQAGQPTSALPARRRPGFAGTDRQARGALLAVVRSADRPVERGELALAWEPAEQRDRALAGLVEDGLVVLLPDRSVALPGNGAATRPGRSVGEPGSPASMAAWT